MLLSLHVGGIASASEEVLYSVAWLSPAVGINKLTRGGVIYG
jgi:hypothetical protein